MASLDEIERLLKEASLKPKPDEPLSMHEVVTSDDQTIATQEFLQKLQQRKLRSVQMDSEPTFSPKELYVTRVGEPDHEEMIKLLRTYEPEFTGDNPCCMVSSIHTAIVVKDETPQHLFKTLKVSEQSGLHDDVDFKDPESLKEWGVKLPVPPGMKVFVVLLSTENCVYHEDYDIRRLGSYFDELKKVMQQNGLTLNTNDFVEYGKAVCESTYKLHTEQVDKAASNPSLVGKNTGAKSLAFQSGPISHRYKIFESGTKTHPYEMNLFINAKSPNQVGFLYSDPDKKSKLVLDSTFVPPGQSYLGFHLSHAVESLHDEGHKVAVFILNGCATKRYFDFRRSAPLMGENFKPSKLKTLPPVDYTTPYTIDPVTGKAHSTFLHSDVSNPRPKKNDSDSEGGKKRSKRMRKKTRKNKNKRTYKKN